MLTPFSIKHWLSFITYQRYYVSEAALSGMLFTKVDFFSFVLLSFTVSVISLTNGAKFFKSKLQPIFFRGFFGSSLTTLGDQCSILSFLFHLRFNDQIPMCSHCLLNMKQITTNHKPLANLK